MILADSKIIKKSTVPSSDCIINGQGQVMERE